MTLHIQPPCRRQGRARTAATRNARLANAPPMRGSARMQATCQQTRLVACALTSSTLPATLCTARRSARSQSAELAAWTPTGNLPHCVSATQLPGRKCRELFSWLYPHNHILLQFVARATRESDSKYLGELLPWGRRKTLRQAGRTQPVRRGRDRSGIFCHFVGAWWLAANAEHMLVLRLNRFNKRWDQYWAQDAKLAA
mgnify:CR=1 FL=1